MILSHFDSVKLARPARNTMTRLAKARVEAMI